MVRSRDDDGSLKSALATGDIGVARIWAGSTCVALSALGPILVEGLVGSEMFVLVVVGDVVLNSDIVPLQLSPRVLLQLKFPMIREVFITADPLKGTVPFNTMMIG